MPNKPDHDADHARKILDKFAAGGARKTSMEEIASAMGVSRQSIYKRFGSKTACYDWAIDTFVSHLFGQIFTLLKDQQRPAPDILLSVFDLYIGKSVKTLHDYHGMSLFRDVSHNIRSSEHDWAIRFQARLAEFLAERQLAAVGNQANGLAFLLISAAKGLMLEAKTQEQFHQDMARLLDSALLPH